MEKEKNEIMEEFFGIVKERFKGVYYKVFVTTWMIINWQVIFIATSLTIPTNDKIEQIKPLINDYERILCRPFWVTIAVIIVSIIMEALIKVILDFINKLRKKAEFLIFKMPPHSKDDFLNTVRQLRLKEKEIDLEVEKYDSLLRTYKDLLKNENNKDSTIIGYQTQLSLINSLRERNKIIGIWTVTLQKAPEFQFEENFQLSIEEHAETYLYRFNKTGKYNLGFIAAFEYKNGRVIMIVKREDIYIEYNLSPVEITKFDDNSYVYDYLEGFIKSTDDTFSYQYVKLKRSV